jgi:dienelactone hydrolase
MHGKSSRLFQIEAAAIIAFLLLACGGDEGTGLPPNTGAGVGVAVAGAGAAGVGVAGGAAGSTTIGGVAGSPTGPGTTVPKPAGSGAAGSGAAGVAPATGGVGGRAGGTAAVGGSTAGTGAAGTGAAGTGAAGTGAAGAAGSGMPQPGGALVRGPEPTMDSVMNNGSYKVQMYTDGFKDGDEFLAGTIYYPMDADPPFAGVVICPGFTAYQDSVAPWGPFLASNGIVVMTIDTNTTADSVDIRQGALLDALSSLKAEQTRMGSPLMGKLDMTRFGLMGWSMGGGGTWLNANTHPELKSAISLAGHILTQIGGAAQLTMVTVPTLMLAGSADTEILGLGMSQPVYEAIPESTPKILYEVEGASHFDIAPETGGDMFGLYGLSWQKVFLEGDMRYRKFLLLPKPANASDFRSNVK